VAFNKKNEKLFEIEELLRKDVWHSLGLLIDFARLLYKIVVEFFSKAIFICLQLYQLQITNEFAAFLCTHIIENQFYCLR